jgi:damage-control phosphatase, subfamily I
MKITRECIPCFARQAFDAAAIAELTDARREKLVVGMRGLPTINDATIHDAGVCDFPDDFRIISNGSDIPGTWLPECDQNFRDIFEKADVVIAKGQGNYETLSDSNRSIYFLLLVKCPAIAKNTGCEPGTYFMKKAG